MVRIQSSNVNTFAKLGAICSLDSTKAGGPRAQSCRVAGARGTRRALKLRVVPALDHLLRHLRDLRATPRRRSGPEAWCGAFRVVDFSRFGAFWDVFSTFDFVRAEPGLIRLQGYLPLGRDLQEGAYSRSGHLARLLDAEVKHDLLRATRHGHRAHLATSRRVRLLEFERDVRVGAVMGGLSGARAGHTGVSGRVGCLSSLLCSARS